MAKNVPNNFIILQGEKRNNNNNNKIIYVYGCIARNTYNFDTLSASTVIYIMEERVLRIRECCAHASCLNVSKKRKEGNQHTRDKKKKKNIYGNAFTQFNFYKHLGEKKKERKKKASTFLRFRIDSIKISFLSRAIFL